MIIDHVRNLKEFKRMFEMRPMHTDVYNLDFILNNPHLYCFYREDNGELSGFIFITENKGRLFLSGVTNETIPNRMAEINTAIITVCNAYNQDMYSDTDLRHAQLVLRKAGFKRLRHTNIFKRSR